MIEAEGDDFSGMPTAERDPAKPVYLRIGGWNPAHPFSHNYAKGDIEAGLSCYDLNEHGQPVIPEEGEWAETDFHERLRSGEPKYLVQGLYCGEGHDGEPLLSHPVIVGMWPDDYGATVQEAQATVGAAGRLQHFIDLAKASPSLADFIRAIDTQVAKQAYRPRGLADAIELRKEGGSLANYDRPSQLEWFGRGTDYATPLPVRGVVTVYRASREGRPILPGDYVTQSQRYARDHVVANLGGGKISRLVVTLDDLFPADGPNEFWYAPHELDAFDSVEDFYERNHNTAARLSESVDMTVDSPFPV